MAAGAVGGYHPYRRRDRRPPCCPGAGLHRVHFTPLPAAKHIFTHIEWHQSGYFLTVSEQPAPAGCVWAGKEQLEAAYTLPGAFKVYKKLLLTKLL